MPTLPESLEAVKNMTPGEWKVVIMAEPKAAVQWMQRAAELNHTDAQITLGQWLLDGHGLERDTVQALNWFLKAATQGHVMGMNMAGRCFDNGWGTEPDHFIAANWFRQAAHAGLDSGKYNYANLLAAGKGVPQNHAEAIQWYRQAADQGHAKSMTKLGHYYEDGRVVPQDMDAAFFCFEEGARRGDFRGMFNYAGMLAARGQLDLAVDWLRRVPMRATPRFKQEAGRLLLQSPHAKIREIGQQMVDSVSKETG